MTLLLKLNGIDVRLKIWNYSPKSDNDWTADWCKTNISFTAEPWLNYKLEEDEVFLSFELEELHEKLGLLLEGKMTEREELEMMEPDFTFIFYPRKDLREDPRVTHVRSGYEIIDISVDWTVTFWHKGLTNNYLSAELNRDEIGYLRSYLEFVMGKKSEEDPVIEALVSLGVLIP